MPRKQQQQEAPKAAGVILGALDRAVHKFDAAVDKGRDAVTSALDAAASKVEDFNTAANNAGNALFASAAARGALDNNDTKAATASQVGASKAQAAPSKGQAEDDSASSSSANSPTAKKTHHLPRPHLKLRIKSPGEIEADVKEGLEKVKQKLESFADKARGTAAKSSGGTFPSRPPPPAPSDAFLGPDQSPKTLEAKRLKRQGAAAASPPPAAGEGGPIQNLFGALESAAKGAVKAVKSPLVAAGHAARTINDVLPEGTLPNAVTNLLPPGTPHEVGERDRFPRLRQFAKRVKLGYYLVKNPQVLKMVAIAGGVLVVGLLMGTGALIMHLVDRRMLS